MTPNPKEQSEREAFEAWYVSTTPNNIIKVDVARRHGNGAYRYEVVERSWQAWNAALDWQAAQQPQTWTCNCPVYQDHLMDRKSCSWCGAVRPVGGDAA